MAVIPSQEQAVAALAAGMDEVRRHYPMASSRRLVQEVLEARTDCTNPWCENGMTPDGGEDMNGHYFAPTCSTCNGSGKGALLILTALGGEDKTPRRSARFGITVASEVKVRPGEGLWRFPVSTPVSPEEET